MVSSSVDTQHLNLHNWIAIFYQNSCHFNFKVNEVLDSKQNRNSRWQVSPLLRIELSTVEA